MMWTVDSNPDPCQIFELQSVCVGLAEQFQLDHGVKSVTNETKGK